jgi:hypothetical protein
MISAWTFFGGAFFTGALAALFLLADFLAGRFFFGGTLFFGLFLAAALVAPTVLAAVLAALFLAGAFIFPRALDNFFFIGTAPKARGWRYQLPLAAGGWFRLSLLAKRFAVIGPSPASELAEWANCSRRTNGKVKKVVGHWSTRRVVPRSKIAPPII